MCQLSSCLHSSLPLLSTPTPWCLARAHSLRTKPPLFIINTSRPPKDGHMPYWVTQTGNNQWVEFSRFCSAVENSYLSKSIARSVAPVLQKLGAGESATTPRDMLLALQTVSVEGISLSESEPAGRLLGSSLRRESSHIVKSSSSIPSLGGKLTSTSVDLELPLSRPSPPTWYHPFGGHCPTPISPFLL